MKLKSDFCIMTATGFLLLYANYFAIMNLFMPGMIKDLYLAFFTALGLVPLFFRQRKLAPIHTGCDDHRIRFIDAALRFHDFR